jgi:ABC-type antimicrobial peptide transport system permease subunit
VGRRFGWGPKSPEDIEIVGVVKDVRWRNLRDAAPAFVYIPFSQPQASPYPDQPPDSVTLAVRVHGDQASLMKAVQGEIEARRGRVRLLTTQERLVSGTLRIERLLARISGFFGALALLLAAVGLFGMMAYTVSRRTGELGIRMALGARPRDVVRMVLGETAALVFAGLIAGVAIASLATRLIESFLFGVSHTDPLLTAIAALILMATALVAAWLPARRASRVQPMMALRQD